MDVIEIDGASNRGIDEIRDLRERVKYAPAQEKPPPSPTPTHSQVWGTTDQTGNPSKHTARSRGSFSSLASSIQRSASNM